MANDLAQLRDIHLPQAISWWPPAPGYGLLLLILVAAVLMALFFYRTRQARHLRKQALSQLTHLQRIHREHLNVSITAAQISLLLKQVALQYYPRSHVAALQGEAWLDFLKQTSKKIPFESARITLLEAPFCAQCNENIDSLFIVAHAWIKQRSRLWLN